MQGPLPDVGILSLLNFESFLGTLVPVIFALALVFFLWGLAKFILHSGEEDAKTEGKRMMLWGVIGLVVMFGIWGIVNLFLSIFSGDLNTIQTPTFPLPPN